MFDFLSPLLQRVQELGTPAPGGWGTTVTPEGGSTMPVNAGGITDAFVSNLKKANPGQAMGKAFQQGMEPPKAASMGHMDDSGQRQAQMGLAGMEALRSMSKPVGQGPTSGGAAPQSPFVASSQPYRSIF